MKNYSAFICLFFLTLVMAGCDKDKDSEPTKQDLLMANQWKLTEAKASATIAGSPFEVDYYNILIACQKDNFLDFNTGGVVVMDEGASKCTPTAPQTTQGTWTLTENATTGDVLTVNGNILLAFGLTNTAARNLTVLTLDNQTLKVTFNEAVTVPISQNPLPAKIDLTFSKQ